MKAKLLVTAMAAGFGFVLNGASAQSVNLQGPPLAQQETTFLQAEPTAMAQASGDGSSQSAQQLVESGVKYEGYTLPGQRDDTLLAARMDETLILREGQEMNVEEFVAGLSNSEIVERLPQ